MKDRKYNILKAASWYTIGNMMIKGVNFFVLPIFTNLMSTHEYGIYSVYLSYLAIFETIILLGLSSTISVAKYAKEVDFESYMSTILVIPIGLTTICMLAINILLSFYGTILSMNVALWNCLFISSAAGAICGIIGARLVIDGKYMLYMAYSGIHTIGNVLISLFLCSAIYRTQNIHLARVYGSTISVVIGMVFLLITTKARISIQNVNVRYALVWGVPLLFHTVATVVLTQSDRILIRYLDSYSSAGIYAVATTILSIPLVLQQSINQAWTPWFYGKLDEKDYKEIKWLNNRYIVLYGVIIACFMLLAPDVVHLFTENSYWPCIYSLVPLAISGFAEHMYSIPVSVEYYNKRTTYIMTATLTTVVLNILLDVIFIKFLGYHGAAYATALSKVILFGMHLSFSKKLDDNSMFSGRLVIVCFALLICLNISIVTTVEFALVRYMILVSVLIPFGLYVLKNKDIILGKLQEK